MRLLILTQKMDKHDPILGFFHRWVEECALRAETVHVICLYEGVHTLPEHVQVHSLGKEVHHSRIRYLTRFFRLIWQLRHEYDAVFVHMNQIYIILGGILWRILEKRICLWYAHGSVPFSLRLALPLAHAVVTSTPHGFRIPSTKVHVVGQGIDASQFIRCPDTHTPDQIRIVYVGRISPIKRCEVLIDAAAELYASGETVSVTLVGDHTAADAQEYVSMLTERICSHGLTERVRFVGAVPNHALEQYLCEADVFANPSVTGSLDKAGLEALASGVPVVTCNEAFTEVFGEYADRLMFPKDDAHTLAGMICALHRSSDRMRLAQTLAERVRREHSVQTLMTRILAVCGNSS